MSEMYFVAIFCLDLISILLGVLIAMRVGSPTINFIVGFFTFILGVYSLANFDLLPFGQYNYLFSIFTMVVGVACIFLAYVDTTD